MNGNGTRSIDEIGQLPGPGLWLLVVDGGLIYLSKVLTIGATGLSGAAMEVTEAEVAHEIETRGFAPLTLRPMIALDSVRAAVAGADRKPEPFSLAISQRIDQRAGLCEDFPVLKSVHAVGFLSTMSPMLRAQLRLIYDNSEATLLAKRAERAGITLSRS